MMCKLDERITQVCLRPGGDGLDTSISVTLGDSWLLLQLAGTFGRSAFKDNIAKALKRLHKKG